MARRKRNKIISEMNVVPYIDVMLVLLIIFMVAAPMIKNGIDVDLPKSNGDPQQSYNEMDNPLVVTIDGKSHLYMNRNNEESIVTVENIISLYVYENELQDGLKVFIRGDKEVKYNEIILLMNNLKNNGLKNIGLVTDTI
jgi:biopolymer transport protein TolR